MIRSFTMYSSIFVKFRTQVAGDQKVEEKIDLFIMDIVQIIIATKVGKKNKNKVQQNVTLVGKIETQSLVTLGRTGRNTKWERELQV